MKTHRPLNDDVMSRRALCGAMASTEDDKVLRHNVIDYNCEDCKALSAEMKNVSPRAELLASLTEDQLMVMRIAASTARVLASQVMNILNPRQKELLRQVGREQSREEMVELIKDLS